MFSGFDSSSGALQRPFSDAQKFRNVRLRFHGGQRGDLRHLPQEVGRGTTDVCKFKPTDQPGGVVSDGFATFRRRVERRPDGVPDEPGAVPSDPLSLGFVRPDHHFGHGPPRGDFCCGDHLRLFSTVQSDGQDRPQ